MARSAPHIYLSALPFAAKVSLIWQYFGPRCTGVVSVEIFGMDRHGRSLIMTLVGHQDRVNSIVYSLDGQHLASISGSNPHDDFGFSSKSGTLRVWNARNGVETHGDNVCR